MTATDVKVWDGTAWQSIKGARGPQGEPGKDSTVPGPKGEKGDPGVGTDGKAGKDGVGVNEVKVLDGNLVVTLSDGTTRLAGHVVGPRGADGSDGRDGRDAPPASPGRDGAPGAPGRDGKDGITADEFEKAIAAAEERAAERILKSLEFDGRVFKIGGRVLGKAAVMEFKGQWVQDGKYEKGDTVQHSGHMWHCNDDGVTHMPGQGSGWTIAVKRGRDGKAGEPVAERTPSKAPIHVR